MLALAACAGETGTIQLELTTAPGSTLLEAVQRLRITITDPRTVVEADRTESGFDVVLDVDATGAAGALIVDGFDAGGTLIASGSSPPFPVAAINARIVVYMAGPLTIGPSPVKLPVARTGVSSAPLTYGLAIAGGQDAAGTETDTIFIYNSYDHSLVQGLPMPAPRSQQTLAVGSNNAVYLFGGNGPDDVPAGTFWRFDTTVPPNGVYTELLDQPELARAGAAAVQLGVDRYVITGTPAIDLTFNALAARGDAPSLSANAAGVVVDNQPILLFAGDPIVRLRDGSFDTLVQSIEPTATAAALPGGRIAFASPGDPATRDLVVVEAASGEASRITDALSSVRLRAAVAASPRHLVVAGGTDLAGVPVASADVFDATTLAFIATVPCAARSGASAYAFGNDQIVIIGGSPENDAIELFTPPSE
jgi:hypothetical protein